MEQDVLPARPSFGQAIGTVFQTSLRNIGTCLALASVYALLSGVGNAIGRGARDIVDPTRVSGEVVAVSAAVIAAFGTLVLVNVFVYPVTIGALSQVGSAAVYGDTVEIGGILRRAFDRGLDAVGALLLTVLLLLIAPIALGILALIVSLAVSAEVGFAVLLFILILLTIPSMYVFVRLSLAIPAVMREGLAPIDALRRSWDLVRGGWWWVFGVGLVIGLVGGVLSGVFSLGAGVVAEGIGGFVVAAVAGAIGAAVSMVIFGVGTGVVYAARALPEDRSGPLEHPVPPSLPSAEAPSASAADAEE